MKRSPSLYDEFSNLQMKMNTIQSTRFPNLFSSSDDARNAITKRSLHALDASEEALYRAWANILKAYRGEDGAVSFHCRHGIVNVDTAESDLQYRPFDESQDIVSRNDTGVFIDSVSGEFKNHSLC